MNTVAAAPRSELSLPSPRPHFSVLDAATPHGLAAWLELWRSWPGREVSAHPEYVRLFARPGDRVVCTVGRDAGGVTLFPLIVRPLAIEPWAAPGEGRQDAITPYGYGGPFSFGEGPRDHGAFWAAQAAWCAEERIVSTFARLSLFPEQLAPVPGRVEVRAPNIAVPLSGGEEELWRGYDTRVRRWIRVAQASGLQVEVDADGRRLDGFLAVYEHTMRRHGAEDWYFFPRGMFESLVARLPGQFAFFHALKDGEVVSSDLVLCSAENVYYFLGGTMSDAFSHGPNYLVKHAVARWAMGAGKRRYVLGGGYEPGDGVFRYKRGWARGGEVPFRVACLEHDAAGCRELRARRAAEAAARGEAWVPRAGFFPEYRG
ncbi:MAG TPA: GNAT family N-acetyltransferase [Anaeromyxobacter sp.]|nr:GNAT family N-acetyltransferase [Anaeromyxobacter sp.]